MPESRHSDADLPSLGRAVRQMREQQGIGAEELAGLSGITPRRLAALESGRLDPPYELLLTIADRLGVQPAALMLLAEQLR